jgi:hypothetical protein
LQATSKIVGLGPGTINLKFQRSFGMMLEGLVVISIRIKDVNKNLKVKKKSRYLSSDFAKTILRNLTQCEWLFIG